MSEKLPQESEFLLYTTPQGDVRLQVLVQDETIWLTQKALAELFKVSKQTISYHLGNIFNDGELQQNSVVKEILTTASDGTVSIHNEQHNSVFGLQKLYASTLSKALL